VQVVHLDGDQPALQLPHRLDRVHARANPVTHVRGRAEARGAPLAGLQDALGVPVARRRLGVVVVQGDVDAVLVAASRDHVQRLGLRLGHERLDAHLPPELEDPPARRLVGRDVVDVVRQQAQARVVQLETNPRQLVIAEVRIEVPGDLRADLLKAQAADVVQAQAGGLVDRLEERELVERVRLHADPPAELLLRDRGGRQGGAGRGGRLQVAQGELDRAQIEPEHLRVPEHGRVVRDRAVERPPAPVAADPRQRVVLVGAKLPPAGQAAVRVELVAVHAQQHANALARIRIVHAEELVAILEALAAEHPGQRVGRVVQLDQHALVGLAMGGAARADHPGELRPVLLRAGPLREAHRRPVHAHQPPAPADELLKVSPKFRVGKQVAHRVVQEDRVEPAQAVAAEDGRVAADDRLEGAGLLAHAFERVVGGRDGPVPAVADVAIEDEQPARPEGLGGRLRGQGRLHPLALGRVF